MLLTQKRATAT